VRTDDRHGVARPNLDRKPIIAAELGFMEFLDLELEFLERDLGNRAMDRFG
jgi:hypothetical protein